MNKYIIKGYIEMYRDDYGYGEDYTPTWSDEQMDVVEADDLLSAVLEAARKILNGCSVDVDDLHISDGSGLIAVVKQVDEDFIELDKTEEVLWAEGVFTAYNLYLNMEVWEATEVDALTAPELSELKRY